ncbi:MAG: hypothetical protein ABI273_14330 [Lacunisphaera sp.]
MGTLLLLPLVLKRLPVEEFNVWALFSALVGLYLLVDMGFSLTFIRALATTLAGASTPDAFERHATVVVGKISNWELLMRVVAFMRFVYRMLGWVYLVLVGLVGSLALVRPISLTGHPSNAWAAWVVVMGCGYVGIRTNYLGVLLQGLNEIALIRRWEAVTSIGSTVCGCAVLYFNGSLLALVIATQTWGLIGVGRNFWLCKKVADGRFTTQPAAKNDAQLFAILWPPTWRSGVGVLMSFGLIQATALLQAQFVSAATSASYLLCLRIIQQISAFSQAPFYSKLSVLPRLRAENRRRELVKVAARGMRLSLWAYVAGFAAAGFFGPFLLRLIGSAVKFPQIGTFILFGSVFAVERYAAMYLQLYNITNDVITHVANGVTGLLCMIFILILWPQVGELALPLGLLAGYLAFYAWFPVRCAYREYGLSFWRFETRNGLGPFLFFVFAAYLLWELSR